MKKLNSIAELKAAVKEFKPVLDLRENHTDAIPDKRDILVWYWMYIFRQFTNNRKFKSRNRKSWFIRPCHGSFNWMFWILCNGSNS